MPTLNRLQVSPPKDEDEFEDICLSAARIRWGDPNFQRNGRRGQRQDGVDLYGCDQRGRRVGVQSKCLKGSLGLGLIASEVEKAEDFVPVLQDFFISTTAPRDATLQKELRLLSADRVAQGKFSVGVLFWDDITNDLASSPAEFMKHFPQDDRARISLVALLDLGYRGSNLWHTMQLLFGEMGVMAGEDPQQFVKLGGVLKQAAANTLGPRESGEFTQALDKLVELSLECAYGRESWQTGTPEAERLVAMLRADMSALGYRLSGPEAAAYTLGEYLATWSRMAFHDQSMTKSFRSHLQQLVTAAGLPTAIVDDIEQMASRYQRLLKDVDVGPVEVDKLPHRAFVAVRDGLEILRVKK